MPFVLDASVALAWCFADEQSGYATGILRRLADDVAVVPSIWPLEVANALLTAERRGRLTSAELLQLRSLFADLPIVIQQSTTDEALEEIINISRTYDLTAYDAAYLGLAAREGVPMATLDSKIRAAAIAAGVSLL